MKITFKELKDKIVPYIDTIDFRDKKKSYPTHDKDGIPYLDTIDFRDKYNHKKNDVNEVKKQLSDNELYNLSEKMKPKNLTDDESYSLKHYTASSSRDTNIATQNAIREIPTERAVIPTRGYERELLKHARNIQSAIEKNVVPKGTTLYGGVKSPPVFNKEGLARHSRFNSTSLSRHIATNFAKSKMTSGEEGHILQYHFPEDHPGINVVPHSTFKEEREVVLPPNTLLRHTKTEKITRNGITYNVHHVHVQPYQHIDIPHPDLSDPDSDKIKHVMDYGDRFDQTDALDSRHVNNGHLHQAIDNNLDDRVQRKAIQHPLADKELVKKFIENHPDERHIGKQRLLELE